jgi:hyaluronoglucosaminidase
VDASDPSRIAPPLGVIEGYYGRPWSWDDRAETAASLAEHGYGFFIYAPKADAYLRRRWRELYPPPAAGALRGFAARCAVLGMEFGVGLSPFELYRDFNAEAKAALAGKLAQFDDLGVAQLAILFDDMRGDLPRLAASQVEILHWIGARTRARKLILCPTYYSDDPALDRFFGARPDGYLEELGEALDPAIEVFWTGPEVCSLELRPGHLARVEAQLRRKPLLWDNYPVNDGPRMSPFLHLRAFTGRSAGNAAHVAGHAINPALQPVLSRLPAITLPEVYALGDRYDYRAAFDRAATQVLGPELAESVIRRLAMFQDAGLDRLGEDATRLRARFSAFDHPAAREIVDWLDGEWRVTHEDMAGA